MTLRIFSEIWRPSRPAEGGRCEQLLGHSGSVSCFWRRTRPSRDPLKSFPIRPIFMDVERSSRLTMGAPNRACAWESRSFVRAVEVGPSCQCAEEAKSATVGETATAKVERESKENVGANPVSCGSICGSIFLARVEKYALDIPKCS